jgi:hypothetical protein
MRSISWGAVRVLMTTVAMTLGVLALTTAPALAAEGYGLTGSFGSAGSGAGELKGPIGIAVDDATTGPNQGDVYVADTGNHRVDEFEADGTFVRAWGAKVEPLGGDVCTPLTGCQQGAEGSGPGEFKTPTLIAVDNSTGASKEDVYVVDPGSKTIDKFSATGKYESQLTGTTCKNTAISPPGCTGSTFLPFGELQGVAVGPSGNLYVQEMTTESSSEQFPTFYIFSDTGVVKEELALRVGGGFGDEKSPGFAVDSAGNIYTYYSGPRPPYVEEIEPAGEGGLLDDIPVPATGLALDPATDDGLLVDVGSAVDLYGPTKAIQQTIPSEGESISESQGVAVNGGSATGAIYATETVADKVAIFTEGPRSEAPKTDAASGELGTTAVLHGELNPGGAKGQLKYHFLYSTEGKCTGQAGVGITPVPGGTVPEADEALVQAEATNLEPLRKYTFCVVAENRFGQTFAGNEESFETKAVPPTVLGESVSNVKLTEATLEGVVNPNNEVTECHFQYNSLKTFSEGVENEIACTPELLEGFGGQGVSSTKLNGIGEPVTSVTRLTPGTKYHYRIVAKNAAGEETKESEFTTAIPPATPREEKAAAITPTTATLHGVLNPNEERSEPGSYEFIYRQSATECRYVLSAAEETQLQKEGRISELEKDREKVAENKATPTTGTSGTEEKVEAPVSELVPGVREYTFCLIAHNKDGETSAGPPEHFTTAAISPVVESVSSSHETPTAAELEATVNPEGAEVKECRFEYGTSTGYGREVACEPATIPAGITGAFVTAHLEGLSANIEYHWRLVAGNRIGTVETSDHTFVYPVSTSTGDVNRSAGECPKTAEEGPGFAHLPDCRAYEQVTPVEKAGGVFSEMAMGVGPGRTPDLVTGSFTAIDGIQNNSGVAGAVYTSVRTDSGWTTIPLPPPATEYETTELAGGLLDYLGGTLDGRSALWQGRRLGQPANRADFWVTRPGGAVEDVGPLTPPDTPKGEVKAITNLEGLAIVPVGESADLSHILYQTRPDFVLGYHFWPFDKTHEIQDQETDDLYEFVGVDNQSPMLVGVGNSGEQISDCGTTLGAYRLPGYGEHGTWNAMSQDGGTVFFTALACGASPAVNELFARIDNGLPDARTVAISEPSPVDCDACDTSPAVLSPAIFQGASSDGSKVFFLTHQPLLGSDATMNLYEYDFDAPVGERIIHVSGGDSTEPNPTAEVEGVVETSEDGSHVYFVARGVLTQTANDRGQVAHEGANNLYVFERDAEYPGGHTAFIADLAPTDEELWARQLGEQSHSSNLTPNGDFLVFISGTEHLTADDTSTANQVFEYDAPTGELVRVSIGQDGYNDDGNSDVATVSIVNDHTCAISGPMCDSGRQTASADGSYVFFTSTDGLTPQALNQQAILKETGRQTRYANNVYEYHDGNVYLISDGHDLSSLDHGSDVELLGTDESGADVLFTTADPLAPTDIDSDLDVYDARIDGGFPAPVVTPECVADSCQGQLSPAPVLLSPGSEFQAGGNPPLAAPAPVAKPKVKKTVKPKRKKKKRARKANHRHRRSTGGKERPS